MNKPTDLVARILELEAELSAARSDAEALEDQLAEAEFSMEDYEEFCTDDPRALADAVCHRLTVFQVQDFRDRLEQNLQMGYPA